MKIYSIDNKSWLSVEPIESEGYTSFEVEASIDIEHGVFEGKNIDVNFFEWIEKAYYSHHLATLTHFNWLWSRMRSLPSASAIGAQF